jgi:hypothetical protein
MTSYSLTHDGMADLALPLALEERLRDALDGNWDAEIRDEIDSAVTAKLQEHGVSADGTWLGDWSAVDIVTGVLDRYELADIAAAAGSRPGGLPVRIAIDADCPACGKPERSFDPATGLFGCSSMGAGPCGYESTERNA